MSEGEIMSGEFQLPEEGKVAEIENELPLFVDIPTPPAYNTAPNAVQSLRGLMAIHPDSPTPVPAQAKFPEYLHPPKS